MLRASWSSSRPFTPASACCSDTCSNRRNIRWTQNWEYYPPNKKMARGLEFSTQPFDVPRREVVQLNQMFGSPVYRWLPARTKIESRFLMFYAHTPEGFGKGDDERPESGKMFIER